MKRYSAFAIAREGLRRHTGWARAWRAPEPKAKYDVVIVGAGGHGLATAYHLGKNHGITNVAAPRDMMRWRGDMRARAVKWAWISFSNVRSRGCVNRAAM